MGGYLSSGQWEVSAEVRRDFGKYWLPFLGCGHPDSLASLASPWFFSCQATPSGIGLQLWTPSQLAETFTLPQAQLNSYLFFPRGYCSSAPLSSPWWKGILDATWAPRTLYSYLASPNQPRFTAGPWCLITPPSWTSAGLETSPGPQQAGWGVHYLLAPAPSVSRTGPWYASPHHKHTSWVYSLRSQKT